MYRSDLQMEIKLILNSRQYLDIYTDWKAIIDKFIDCQVYVVCV